MVPWKAETDGTNAYTSDDYVWVQTGADSYSTKVLVPVSEALEPVHGIWRLEGWQRLLDWRRPRVLLNWFFGWMEFPPLPRAPRRIGEPRRWGREAMEAAADRRTKMGPHEWAWRFLLLYAYDREWWRPIAVSGYSHGRSRWVKLWRGLFLRIA